MAPANIRFDYGLAGLHENNPAKTSRPNAWTPETIGFWRDRLRCRPGKGNDRVVDRLAP